MNNNFACFRVLAKSLGLKIAGAVVLVLSFVWPPAASAAITPYSPSLRVCRYGTKKLEDHTIKEIFRGAVFNLSESGCKQQGTCPIRLKPILPAVYQNDPLGRLPDEAKMVGLVNYMNALNASVGSRLTYPIVFIVDRIDNCAGPDGPGDILGCSDRFNTWIAIRSRSGRRGLILAHEYGHARGLKHRNAPCALMNATITDGELFITQKECDVLCPQKRPRSGLKKSPAKTK